MSINSVNVNAWGNGNDCWWNIAAEQAGKGASAEKIASIMEEIQTYNEDKNDTVGRQNDVLYEGEQIYIPLKYAMDEISEKITTAKTEFSDAAGDVKDRKGDLDTAKSNYESMKGEIDGDTVLAQTAKQLKEVYETAQTNYDKAVEKYNKKKVALEKLQDDYNQLKEDYEEEYNAVQDEYAELEEEINGIDKYISDKELELNEAEKEAEQEPEEEPAQADTGIPTLDDPFNIFLNGGILVTNESGQPEWLINNGSDNQENKTSNPTETPSATTPATETPTKAPIQAPAQNQMESDTPIQNALNDAANGDTSKLQQIVQGKSQDELNTMLDNEDISLFDFEAKLKEYGIGQPQAPTRPALS